MKFTFLFFNGFPFLSSNNALKSYGLPYALFKSSAMIDESDFGVSLAGIFIVEGVEGQTLLPSTITLMLCSPVSNDGFIVAIPFESVVAV